MKFDFDERTDRRGTDCLKYDFAAENGRSADDLPVWIADMDFRTAPAVVEALKRRAEHGIFGYTAPKRDYFEAVARWFAVRHSFEPDPDGFFTAPGVVFAMHALVCAFTNEGDGVLICQPVYCPFATTVKYTRRKLVVSELKLENGRYEVDFTDFERKIKENNVKAFLLCNPHNPVGRVWTESELKRMGDICLEHGVFVISDEIHCDFVYGGAKHTVFAAVDSRYADNCAVCTAPTKTFNIAGLQIANIYVPDKNNMKKFLDALDFTGYWEPNIMGLEACRAAYTEGGEWLDALLEYIAGNLGYVRKFIAENLPEVELIEPEGTYLVWLDCRRACDPLELPERMERAGLWTDDGCDFGAGGMGFERINIACPRATLEMAMERLKKALK